MNQLTREDAIKALTGCAITSIDVLDTEFDIVDQMLRMRFLPAQIPRFVRRCVVDRLYSWLNYIHSFIQPSQHSILHMHEYSMFSEEDRQHLQELARKIMLLTRIAAKLDLSSSPDDEVKYIKTSLDSWLAIKKELLKYTTKNIAGWEKPLPKDDERSQY
ncbi:MAG TPA: hypothetical protein VK158_06485 [Acidobacteriota bacterium]|nr:hypothetical protein [Acidobacteriota bacterium]